MAIEQTWDKCEYFIIRNLCPYRKERLMMEFTDNVGIVGNIKNKIDLGKESEVNEKYCNYCASFKLQKPKK